METVNAFTGQDGRGAQVVGIVCEPETPAEALEAMQTAESLRKYYGAERGAIYFADGYSKATPEQRAAMQVQALDDLTTRAEAEREQLAADAEEMQTWECVQCDLYAHCARHSFTPCELDAEQSAEERADDLRAAFRQ